MNVNYKDLIERLKDEANKVEATDKPKAIKEKDFYEKSNKEVLKGKKQDRRERKKYAHHIFWFTWLWCLAIIVIITLTGIGILKFDNKVIITLITTTTANIVALFVIVARYLFFREEIKNSKKAKKTTNKKKSKTIN